MYVIGNKKKIYAISYEPARRGCSRKYLHAGDNEQQFYRDSLVLIRNHDRRRHENQVTKRGGGQTSVNKASKLRPR